MTTSRTLLVGSCLFMTILLGASAGGLYLKREARIAWCTRQGYSYDDQARHIGRLIIPQIACLDDERRIVAIPE